MEVWQNMGVPPDSINDEKINKRIFTVAIGASVSSLEAFSENLDKSDSLIVELPAYVFPYIDGVFEGSYNRVIKAWQTFPKQVAKGIVEKIKSKLLNHPDVHLYELDGYNHGDMAVPAHPILKKHIHRILNGKK